MKKLLLVCFFIGGLLNAQNSDTSIDENTNDEYEKLIFKVGVNAVDNSGDLIPFDFEGSVAFTNFYFLELEYRFSKPFSLALDVSMNEWEEGSSIDGDILTNNQEYLALDLELKYYFDFFKTPSWLEPYLQAGVGYFLINKGDASLNFGSGVNFWFTDNFGLSLTGTGKWAVNHGETLYDTNHFQYSAGLLFNLAANNKDNDNDGIKNQDDDCPNVAGVAENNGCPEKINDSDGDGVIDTLDRCPNEYGTENGCPMEVDTDGDSVLDSVDDCPKIKGLPTNNGCPLPDSDNDGIVDVADKCPTVPGIAANNGCPYEEIMVGATDTNLNTKSREEVLFNTNKTDFKELSLPILIEITQMMKQHPDAKFRIEGYTDSVGPADFNMRLSQSRANAVRDYLISSGIPAENLIVEAFGESNPRVSNLTKDGRLLNRRVEIIRIE